MLPMSDPITRHHKEGSVLPRDLPHFRHNIGRNAQALLRRLFTQRFTPRAGNARALLGGDAVLDDLDALEEILAP